MTVPAVPLVVLDLGSTLIDGPDRGPAQQLADLTGLDVQHKRAIQDVLMTVDLHDPGHAADVIGERTGVAVPHLKEAVQEVWESQLTAAYLLPGVIEALDSLAGHCRFAVLSNIWTPFLASARALLGDFLDRNVPSELQVFSCRAGRRKPEPSLFTELCATARVKARDAIMVGDSYGNDIAPALGLGMRAIWVTDRPQLHSVQARPELVVASFADIREHHLESRS